MSSTLQEMTQDIQARIRETAYLMWESAGRQQGMAMEYWLRAEQEVLSALQAAASRMMPGVRASMGAAAGAKPEKLDAPRAAEARPQVEAAPAAVTAEAEKSAARKSTARSKVKV